MKAQPVKLVYGVGYIPCSIDEVTHLKLHIPGPSNILYLPVMTTGRREGTGKWSWNGDIEKPTLMPSVLTHNHLFRCHSWINEGKVQYLSDTTHDLVGQTRDLIDLD